jgi:mono/diheme cytochrome c family protein
VKGLKGIWVTAVGVMAALALSGAVSVRATEQAKPAQKATVKGDAIKGRDTFVAQRCSLCHMINGSGGVLGPDLTAVGTRRNAAWLYDYLPNPQATKPENKMPPVAAKGQDLDDLVAYLLSLKGKTRGSTLALRTSVEKPALSR